MKGLIWKIELAHGIDHRILGVGSNPLTVVAIVAVAAGFFCGYLVYSAVRDMVAHSRISLLPSLPQTSVVEAKAETVAEPAKVERITPTSWNRSARD